MKQKNPMRRLAINIVALLIIAAVAFLANRPYAAQKGPTLDQIDLPTTLSSMKVVEAKVDIAKVQVAIEIVGEDEPAITADFVTLYRWGRSHFRPVKCGKEYPPDLCQYGEVHILLLVPKKNVPSTAGPVEVYLTKVELWLDQVQIDTRLDPTVQLTSFAEIDELHNSVAQETQGTGGGAELVNEIFTGLK